MDRERAKEERAKKKAKGRKARPVGESTEGTRTGEEKTKPSLAQRMKAQCSALVRHLTCSDAVLASEALSTVDPCPVPHVTEPWYDLPCPVLNKAPERSPRTPAALRAFVRRRWPGCTAAQVAPPLTTTERSALTAKQETSRRHNWWRAHNKNQKHNVAGPLGEANDPPRPTPANPTTEPMGFGGFFRTPRLEGPSSENPPAGPPRPPGTPAPYQPRPPATPAPYPPPPGRFGGNHVPPLSTCRSPRQSGRRGKGAACTEGNRPDATPRTAAAHTPSRAHAMGPPRAGARSATVRGGPTRTDTPRHRDTTRLGTPGNTL